MKLKSAVSICSMNYDDLCRLVAKLQAELALSEANECGHDRADQAKAIRREVTRLLKPGAGP